MMRVGGGKGGAEWQREEGEVTWELAGEGARAVTLASSNPMYLPTHWIFAFAKTFPR